jgi:signal transduction histidine kinase
MTIAGRDAETCVDRFGSACKTSPARGVVRATATAPPMTHTDHLARARLRSLARLAAPLAHDLRGAASTVAVHAALLAGAPDVDDDPAARARRARWGAALDEARERILALVERFLGEVHEPSLDADAFDLRTLAGDAVALLAPAAGARRRTLSLVAAPEPVPVVASRDVVLQALVDVALAALDTAPPDGPMTIAATGEAGARLAVTPAPVVRDDAVAATLAAWGGILEAAGGSLVVRGGEDGVPTVQLTLPQAGTERR